MKKYRINEIFGPTLQGEGVRTGTVNVWLRFAHCNLDCSFCDTQFNSPSIPMTQEEIIAALDEVDTVKCRNVVLSGGEPAMQLDTALLVALKADGWFVAIETNGTQYLPPDWDEMINLKDAPFPSIDWVCCSPKPMVSGGNALRVQACHELKYVIKHGDKIPETTIHAAHFVLSPMWSQDIGVIPRENLEWCIRLCYENPKWRLSTQDHKWWGVR